MTKAERKADARAAYEALMKFYPLTLDNLDGEEWKDIANYDGKYQISNFGRVKSFCRDTCKILKPLLNPFGYLTASLCGKRKFIHRLVVQAFIPNPHEKPQVNHRDGHKLNNHVDNLEWATAAENSQHAKMAGLRNPPQGADSSSAKLSAVQVSYIRDNPDGLNMCELARMFFVNYATISLIQLGKTYRNVGGNVRAAKKQRISSEIRCEIRRTCVKGSREFGMRALAKKFNVDEKTIWFILKEGD